MTKLFSRLHAVGVLIWLFISGALTAQPSEPSAITTGVSIALSPPVPGPLRPTSGGWWSLIDGPGPDRPIMAATRDYGDGRVVALSAELLHQSVHQDNQLLINNMISWLSLNARKTFYYTSGHLEWLGNIVADPSQPAGGPLESTLSNLGFTLEELPGEVSDASLTNTGVLLIATAWGSFTPAEIEAIKSFVSAGGGLLLTGLGWSWEPYNPGKTMDDYPMHQVGAPYGIRWLTGAVDTGVDKIGDAMVFRHLYPDTRLAASPSQLGVFTNGSWFLDRNGDFAFDPATEITGWGSPGDTPVRADWNGDGIDDVGVFSGGPWFLDLNGDGVFDPSTEIKGWGAAGWLPMVGDWNGDGVTDLGVIDPSTMTWFLDLNGDFAFDSTTEIVGWGSPGDTPVVGDWNGDGKDSVGAFSGGLWFIDVDGDKSFDPVTELKGWGVSGWLPVVGDWNGDGVSEIGAVDPSTMVWFRDINGDFAFDPSAEMLGWGSPAATPVVGDWNGDGRDKVGVFDGGIWFIDLVGDQSFDPITDFKGWGVAGWTPVPGKW